MNDKKRFLFGLCRMSVSMSAESLMNRCAHAGIELFDVTRKQDEVFFYCAVDQKRKLMKLIPDSVYHKTTGVMGFVFHELHRPFHLFLLVWVIVLYSMLSHTLFKIRFQSTSPTLQQKIEQYLDEINIHPGNMILSDDFDLQLKQDIKTKFMHDIAWIEVHRSASVLNISFNHKETVEVESFQSEPLISFKHAIVVRFNILHGYKAVKQNQVVYPGDVLVQPYLVDSAGTAKPLYVSGTVYGMTWYTVKSEITNHTEIEVLDFIRLLMDCRRQIESEITEGEEILKENILQVTSNEGKICMTVHYTCLEDITKQ